VTSQDLEIMKHVFFLRSGLTAVTDDDGKHIGNLQTSWLMLFVNQLVAQGEDPEQFRFTMPDGTVARVFKTEAGYGSCVVCEKQSVH